MTMIIFLSFLGVEWQTSSASNKYAMTTSTTLHRVKEEPQAQGQAQAQVAAVDSAAATASIVSAAAKTSRNIYSRCCYSTCAKISIVVTIPNTFTISDATVSAPAPALAAAA